MKVVIFLRGDVTFWNLAALSECSFPFQLREEHVQCLLRSKNQLNEETEV